MKDLKKIEKLGTLSALYKAIINDIGVTTMSFSRLMTQYLDKKSTSTTKNAKSRSIIRGNLSRELKKPNMTWRNFETGLKFLNPIRVKLIIEIEWTRNRTTVHEKIIIDNTDKVKADKEKEKD